MSGNEKVEYTSNGLKQLIENYEAISFDIFDTLVMRKVYFNQDVFRIVAKKYREEAPDFFTVRVQSERELSRTRYPYIEEIYEDVAEKCGLSEALAFQIMTDEIETERQVIIARKSVVDIFNACKQSGKKVYIVSDMYIHQNDLEDIINKIGIVGYEKIFVSCEYGTSKPQHLFECYKKEVKADSYLHIGDSFLCDVVSSSKQGIENFRLKTSAEIWESMGGKVSDNFEMRLRQAEYISDKFNSPFSDM